MSTTLTNGLKLPDKGSVDWYADMQNNYTILDGAVGTVAEHTTQIAGKAPAVHTHGKADITDLFNSANTWTESQTYSKTTISNAAEVLHCKNANVALGETPTSDYQKLFIFKDKNNDNFGYYRHLYQTTGSSQFGILIRNKFTNGAPDTSGSIDYLSFSLRLNADKSKEGVLMGSFKPSNTNTYDLGSSRYQWNNLYAQTYYYNGTAWGLDKENVWTNTNTFTAYVESIGSSAGGEYSSNTRTNFWLMSNRDTEEVSGILFDTYRQNTVQGTGIHILGIGIKENSVRYEGCRWGWYWDNNLNGYTFDFKPTTQGANQALKHNLGTSNDKWNTINGINPGALSLPNLDSTVSLTTTLQAAIDKTQTVNSWTANFTGILCINWITKNITGPYRCSVYNASDIKNATWGQTFWADNVWYFIVSFPVQNGKTYYFDNTFTRTSEDSAHIVHSANAIYTLGNV